MIGERSVDLVEDDGSLTRTTPAPYEAKITMEILKHGSHVQVLEPEWLINKVFVELRSGAK